MRVHDRAVPTPTIGDRPGDGSPIPSWWPDLFVTFGRLPSAAYQWDDYQAAFDDPEERYFWDDLQGGDRQDATCNVAGIEIQLGGGEPGGRMNAGSARVTLDNRSGEWSQYDSSGRLVVYGPGVAVDIWAEVDSEAWWLFSGRVTGWHERADRTVEIEAFDRFSDLNESIGTWTPGTYGQNPSQRINTILDLVADPAARRLDTGRVALHAMETTATVLEELQAVAESDGGVFLADADGTLLYLDRDWRGGRSDQTVVRRFTDNVCP